MPYSPKLLTLSSKFTPSSPHKQFVDITLPLPQLRSITECWVISLTREDLQLARGYGEM